MGQKVHPKAFRLGISTDWDANWYGDKKNYRNFLKEDVEIRKFVKKEMYHAGISRIAIERVSNRITVIIYTGKPGIVIGRGGAEIEKLRDSLRKKIGKQVYVKVIEVKKAEADAVLVAENIALQLEKRISFRRAMKQSISRAMKSGALGIKVAISGRLGGAEMARCEWASDGKVPLQTMRAKVDYAHAEADTTYGKIGVKVWVYQGEVLPEKKDKKEA